jgi:hypothetical protein
MNINELQPSILFLEACNQAVIFELTINLKIKKNYTKGFLSNQTQTIQQTEIQFQFNLHLKELSK